LELRQDVGQQTVPEAASSHRKRTIAVYAGVVISITNCYIRFTLLYLLYVGLLTARMTTKKMQASVNEHSQLEIDVVHVPVYLIREILPLYLNYVCTSD